jgi:predicted acyl esterase
VRLRNLVGRLCAVLFIAAQPAVAQVWESLSKRGITADIPDSLIARYDLFLAVGTDSLDATYFVPLTMSPPGGFPCLITVHGFGLSKDTVNAKAAARAGFISVCYSVRGHGNSSGLSNIMSEVERADLRSVVQFVRSIPGLNPAKIGIQGGSQGGLHGLWAAADTLVSAVSADVITPHWASNELENGSIRRTVVFLLTSDYAVRYETSARDTLWEYVRTDNYDSLKSAFTRDRDVDTTTLERSPVPLLWSMSYQDLYFTAADGIASHFGYAGPKNLYIGTGSHYSDRDAGQLAKQYEAIFRWFSYFLMGNGTITDRSITFAYSSLPVDSTMRFTWSDSTVINDLPSTYPLRFYLAADSSLSYSAAAEDTLTLHNRWNSQYTFDMGYIEGFRGSWFYQNIPKEELAFESQPLENDHLWLGQPHMRLKVSSAYEKFPLHLQIFERDTSGEKHFINRVNLVVRHWTGGDSGFVDALGAFHAHRFSKGSRIRVELTNIDAVLRGTPEMGMLEDPENTGDSQPYVFALPTFFFTEATVHLGQSYVEFPFTEHVSSVASRQIPHVPELAQNYPNPFNPSTTVSFRAPSSHATLRVYDLLGRYVMTPFDGPTRPGQIQTIQISMAGLASGTYFYVLDAGGKMLVKRMLLLR